MNEVLAVPPLLQLNSTEDVVTFVHVRSLLRKLGRQYKTRSALFFVQQSVVVLLFILIFLIFKGKEHRAHGRAVYEGFAVLTAQLIIITFLTFVSILFHGAKLNYSSKLIGDYLYSQENDVRRDISGMITKSQVLNTAINLDIVRKRELADVLHLAVSRIQNQEPVKVFGFIPATFAVLSIIPPLIPPAVLLFNNYVLASLRK